VHLKNGERYNFYRIRTVKIENHQPGKLITINGNFKKQGKYKEVSLWRRIIQNIRSFENLLDSSMKYYEYDGICPKCNSTNITRYESRIVGIKLNDYRRKEYLVESELIHIQCDDCKEFFNEEEMKYIGTIVYYK
jgi:predicted nucleic-acid-binding Zn-ribbon protein